MELPSSNTTRYLPARSAEADNCSILVIEIVRAYQHRVFCRSCRGFGIGAGNQLLTHLGLYLLCNFRIALQMLVNKFINNIFRAG